MKHSDISLLALGYHIVSNVEFISSIAHSKTYLKLSLCLLLVNHCINAHPYPVDDMVVHHSAFLSLVNGTDKFCVICSMH